MYICICIHTEARTSAAAPSEEPLLHSCNSCNRGICTGAKYIYIYVCVYIYIYVCVCTCIYTHTQKLERAQQLLKKSRMKDYYAVMDPQ